jgi:TPR repeat protein
VTRWHAGPRCRFRLVFCCCLVASLLAACDSNPASSAAAVQTVAGAATATTAPAPDLAAQAEASAAIEAALETATAAIDQARYDDALALLDPLAADGVPLAQYLVARASIDGWRAHRDYATAYPLARRAAEAGLYEAQLLLADMYAYGYGVPQDLTQAVEWSYRAGQTQPAQADAPAPSEDVNAVAPAGPGAGG